MSGRKRNKIAKKTTAVLAQNVNVRKKNYKIDLQKAIEQKMNSCAANNMKIEVRDQHNVMLYFSTAAFHIARKGLLSMFHFDIENVDNNRNVTYDADYDGNG